METTFLYRNGGSRLEVLVWQTEKHLWACAWDARTAIWGGQVQDKDEHPTKHAATLAALKALYVAIKANAPDYTSEADAVAVQIAYMQQLNLFAPQP